MNENMRNEIRETVDRMKKARSWKELNMTIADVCTLLERLADIPDTIVEKPVAQRHEDTEELSRTIQELNDKIARLTTTNKQLRAENKTLRAEGKE